MEKRVKKVDFWVLTIHIIRNTFSLVETGYKRISSVSFIWEMLIEGIMYYLFQTVIGFYKKRLLRSLSCFMLRG